MSQFSALAEIIPLVIPYLAYEKHTLHSLLTVNKVCFNVAVPILYNNPFRSCFWNSPSRSNTQKILYLLLTSSKLAPERTRSTTELPDPTLDGWDLPTSPFTVNYLDYYTEINYSEWACLYDEGSFEKISGLGLAVCRSINFSVCEYNAEKLKSVCLPILDVKSYLPLATRMSSLQRLEFYWEYKKHNYIVDDRDILEMQDAIEFVKIHVETFGDTLTEIKIPNLIALKCEGDPLDVQIWNLIRTLKRPSVIEVDSPYGFCKYIQGPTVEHLRVFNGSRTNDDRLYSDWMSFVQHCPKLEKIQFFMPGPDSFKWAVERRALRVDSGLCLNNAADIKLPPLRDVDMECMFVSSLPTFRDIIYAFRDTLRNIIVKEHFLIRAESLKWDWFLPSLVKIQIENADLTLFDFESLNFCPSLEELYLIRSRCKIDSVTEFGPVLRLPNLRKIQLEFGTSYKFNFTSLEYSPLLESLTLSNDGSSILRSTDSPCSTWTWDCRLPHLKSLWLVGEPAALFQFRLLDSCPLLENLSLNLGDYHRTLTLNEILKTDVSTEHVSEVISRNEISRKRKTFYLHGFKISGETLFALLQRYMTHFADIRLYKLGDLTSTDIINATQKLAHVRDVKLSFSLTGAEIQHNGT
ncbi:hypothetical protein K7432_006129 [Basidiobolus ranarum]|uniref:Uncharacterized protein n=1 Tax=Basidiobolus ranarum TaxID=34480 RepID=A0ABR2W233_9FUNG